MAALVVVDLLPHFDTVDYAVADYLWRQRRRVQVVSVISDWTNPVRLPRLSKTVHLTCDVL